MKNNEYNMRFSNFNLLRNNDMFSILNTIYIHIKFNSIFSKFDHLEKIHNKIVTDQSLNVNTCTFVGRGDTCPLKRKFFNEFSPFFLFNVSTKIGYGGCSYVQ